MFLITLRRIVLLLTLPIQTNLLQAQNSEPTPAEIQRRWESDLRGLKEHGILIPEPGSAPGQEPIRWSAIQTPPNPVGGVVSFKALTHKVPKPAGQAFQRGDKLAKSGKHAESAAQFALALELDPQLAPAAVNLGVQRAQSGDVPGAFEALDLALRIDPVSASAHYNLAVLWLRAGRAAEAEPHLRLAILFAPGDAPSRFALGYLLWKREGASPEARELMEASAHAVPGSKELMKMIGAK
jgi:tetratricopeptide (TPR) repeat protein